MDSLVEFYDHLKQQNDFVEDVVQPQAGTKIGTGQTSAEKELARLQVIGELDKIFRQMKQNLQIPSVDIEKLKSEIGAISETPTQNPLQRGVQEYPMRPVLSSFIKGAGAHNGKLLLEFHHSPGKIWSYDVEGQGAKFFQDLLNSGSKGGWVWNKILGKPSVFGMQKGKLYSYNQGGNQQYFTSKGAQFVHLYGRPTLLSSNPVGYTMPQEQYENLSEQWKKFKEVVEPPTSRQAIRIGKLKENQEQKYNIWQQIQKAFQKGGKKDFVYIGNINDFGLTTDSLEECKSYYTKKGKPEEVAEKICFASMNKAQTTATKKTKEKVPSQYDIFYVKDKLSLDDRRKLDYIDIAVRDFPKKAFKKANPKIIVLNKLTDHPNFPDEIPSFYREVGIDKTYKEVPGSYQGGINTCFISLDQNTTPYDFYKTIHHEIAHSVWYYGELPYHLREALEYEVNFYKGYIEDKYYWKPTEMFALLFELHGAKMKERFMHYAGIKNEYIAQRFLDIGDKIWSWAEE